MRGANFVFKRADDDLWERETESNRRHPAWKDGELICIRDEPNLALVRLTRDACAWVGFALSVLPAIGNLH